MAPPSFVQVFDDVWIAGKRPAPCLVIFIQSPLGPCMHAFHTHPDRQPTNQHTINRLPPHSTHKKTGLLSEADVAELSPQFKGWLYLNTDVDGDEGMYLCGCINMCICIDRPTHPPLGPAYDTHTTLTHPTYPTVHPPPGAPGGFPTVARLHPGAQHVAVNNKELSLALAGRLMAALDGMPRPLLISCRCVLGLFWVCFGFWF